MSSPRANPWFPERRCDSGLNPGESPVHHPPDPPDPPDHATLIDFPPLPSSSHASSLTSAFPAKKKADITILSQETPIRTPLA
ncbi:hypothetical protein Bca52824_089698 [Brassica carinata]|uniref:Uncharacterized protein n=1 Tax=Brassica carinata TaxID=52824 RepID=A0A8X7PF06_BRACI|nr:hypothetical protein Bca52824_089698 [Brassica carinata]